MDLSRNQEEEIPLPINSYGHGQVMHHHHHQQQQQQDHDLLSSVEPQIPATYRGPTLEGHHQVPLSNKKGAMKVRYRECLKNHAASMGGNATDGCGEFMPSGAEGTIEALTCSACSCHRNFHRKETDHHHHHQPHILGHLHPQPLSLGCPTLIPLRAATSASARYNNTSADQYYNVDDHHRQVQFVKKRFRTKFTPEQKGKMLEFAERTGWRLQRQEEGVVQQFCQEIGVKRRVLKVWMHNNKHNLARKNDNNND